MGAAIAVYSAGRIDGHASGSAIIRCCTRCSGVCGAFLTGDLFNLYVWFEVMLMASFVLLALGGDRPQIEGAMKYVTLNLVASAFFLAAVGSCTAVTRVAQHGRHRRQARVVAASRA
jgi:multicomponent Na+:H+ antiporter subunit D